MSGTQKSVTVLNADLEPIGAVFPCQSRVDGPFLGAATESDPEGRTITLTCALLDGHEGDHYFKVEWTDPSPTPQVDPDRRNP